MHKRKHDIRHHHHCRPQSGRWSSFSSFVVNFSGKNVYNAWHEDTREEFIKCVIYTAAMRDNEKVKHQRRKAFAIIFCLLAAVMQQQQLFSKSPHFFGADL